MATEQNNLPAIIAHCKEYGFIFPSSEIYDGLSAVYDYGQWGVELKKNIKDLWWKSMVYMNENIVGIDSAIFMHPTIWKASGHVDNFSDPMIDNLDSKKRYRVDHLIEGFCEDLKEIRRELAYKEFPNSKIGDIVNHAELSIVDSNEFKLADELLAKMDALLAADDFAGLKQLIVDNQMKCAVSGTCNWTDVRQFNLMFNTQLGSVAEDSDTIYLRPETAQGIFVNFLNVQKTGRMKIPFGIAQIGKAFRNEIVARGFIFRMREFEQMEMQFFVRPGTQKDWYEHWKAVRMQWHMDVFGADKKEKYRFHDHVKLAHYADAACDIEFDFPMGFKELEGIHSRTDFDLSQHQLYSKKKMQYFDNDIDEATGKPYGNYIPYVVETSVGLDRTILSALSHAYQEEDLSTPDKQDSRVVLKFPIKIAPIKLAVLPLMKKDGLAEIAKDLMNECRDSFLCFYEEKDSIGKRYRRMDALGTPFCVTIDHQTKEDGTVTIRYRDSMEQERVKMSEVKGIVLNALHK